MGPLGIGDAILAKVFGLLESLCMIKSINIYECVVEGDSKTVISWGNGNGGGSWRVNHFICEIRDIMRTFKVVLRHIPRDQNDLADRLAKWSISQLLVFKGESLLEF